MSSSSFSKGVFNFFKIVWVLVALFFLVKCTPIIYMVATAPSCDEGSKAVAYARSLSSDRLARLYSDMEKHSINADPLLNAYRPMDDSWKIKTPDEFKDLKVVRITPDDGNIMVQGCFDHYVYMRFLGVGHLKEFHKELGIELSWGEYTTAGNEMIWLKN